MTPTTEPNLKTGRKYRFGIFEVDFAGHDLKKRGMRIKIQQKPLQVLELLIERRGELVSRADLARHLWPGLHVSFDSSLNTAMNMLRLALGDSSQTPRFIETRPGLGYRFVAPVEILESSPPAQAQPSERAATLVVLPFENCSEDPALNDVADGIAEGLIIALSRMNGIRVIARSTAFRFRSRNLDVQDVGRRLNVRAVVTGRIEQRDASLAIAVELVDVETGSRLWGQRFEPAPADAETITRDVAVEIAHKLCPALSKNSARNASSHDLEEYEDYLKGRYFHHKRREEDLRKSVAHFEAVLARDPNYALAHTGLADTYNLFAFMGILPAHDAEPLARRYALAALRIDPGLAEAHASMAAVKKLYDWDWRGAETEYQAALRLNPNYANGRQSFAAMLSALGRHELALREIREAHNLDPLSLGINMELAWILYMHREYQSSMEQSWRTLTLEARFAPAQQTLGLAYEQMGMLEEAIVEFQNAVVCSERHPASLAALSHAYATAGQRSEAEALMDEIARMSAARYVPPYWMALAHLGMRDHDRALACLRRALELHDVWLLWLNVEPRFDPLRGDAGFQLIVRSAGLA